MLRKVTKKGGQILYFLDLFLVKDRWENDSKNHKSNDQLKTWNLMPNGCQHAAAARTSAAVQQIILADVL